MIILTLVALLISGGAAPVFVGILATYDLVIMGFIFRKKLLTLFKLSHE